MTLDSSFVDHGTDLLQIVNDELRSEVCNSPSPWLPLESNPEIFTSFAQKISDPRMSFSPTSETGCYWRFVDVLSLDPNVDPTLLAITIPPQSVVAACVLLFPCSQKIYAERRKEYVQCMKEMESESNARLVTLAARSMFHIEQVSSFGNACGTVAAVHALTNLDLESLLSCAPSAGPSARKGPVADFCANFSSHTPKQRGEALVRDPQFRSVSDQAATHNAAQTSCPNRDGPALDHHYCAFVPHLGGDLERKEVRVIELDGTKPTPVDHGLCAEGLKACQDGCAGGFLAKVCEVVQKKFVSVDPENIEFSMMALIYGPAVA